MRCSTQKASAPASWRDCCNDRTPGRTKPDHEGVDETRPVASPGCCAASRACCVTRDQHFAPDAGSYAQPGSSNSTPVPGHRGRHAGRDEPALRLFLAPGPILRRRRRQQELQLLLPGRQPQLRQVRKHQRAIRGAGCVGRMGADGHRWGNGRLPGRRHAVHPHLPPLLHHADEPHHRGSAVGRIPVPRQPLRRLS